MKPVPEVRDPRSATCGMCKKPKRIVQRAGTLNNVLICDTCDTAEA